MTQSPSVERLSPAGHPLTGLAPIGLSFANQVLSGDPQEAAHVFHDRAIGRATVGIWESAPGRIRFDPYPFDELCIVVEGEVTLAPDGERPETFRAGDLFIVRETFRGEWIMPRSLRKFYVEMKAS